MATVDVGTNNQVTVTVPHLGKHRLSILFLHDLFHHPFDYGTLLQ